MALGVLRNTAEADYAAAVTGHLGPQAPPELDGAIFISIAQRRAGKPWVVDVARSQLAKISRVRRQQEAARLVLERLAAVIRDA
jgi:nicotinamide-nucleotide amidase